MIIHDIYQPYDKPIVVALGFFDCIHIGHGALIDQAQHFARRYKSESALFTFQNDPNVGFGRPAQIYTIEERSKVLEDLGVENLISAKFDAQFSALTAEQFLDLFTTNYNVKGFVAGNDYKFGFRAQGDVGFLKEYAQRKNMRTKIVPFEKQNNKKISTSNLKKYVQTGSIEKLNTLLTSPYFIIGTVVHAHNRGSVIGYPTANLSVHPDSLHLGDGVYATKIYAGDSCYFGMTNIGAKPTFDDENYSIETYIFDFHKNLYGKQIRVEFYRYMRPLKKFTSVPALLDQLVMDEKNIREFFGLEVLR